MSEIIKQLTELLGDAERAKYVLRLYVSGTTPQSSRAIANLTAICEHHLKGRYDLEVVDLYQSRELAKQNQIVVAPTLIKELPPPFRRLIGDLADTPQVLLALGIKAVENGETPGDQNAGPAERKGPDGPMAEHKNRAAPQTK